MSTQALPNSSTTSKEITEPWGRLIPCVNTLDSIVLNRQSIKIGRIASCDIVIDQNRTTLNNPDGISKEHCIITREPADGKIYIMDLSKNGTYINGVRIGKNNRCALKDNDKIAMLKDRNECIFQSISLEELPDTLTGSTESPMDLARAVIPMWGRLVSHLLHLHSFDLCDGYIRVGRSQQCDIIIDNMEIHPTFKRRFSKVHFIICREFDSSITIITDVSRSGTYLNGHLIGLNNRNVLQHDDTIGIGPKKTRVYVYKALASSDNTYLPPELRTKYEISAWLGKGACGEVRLAYEKYTLKMYAIKKILKARSTTSQIYKLNHPSKIKTEIKILESLSNPFVIAMKEIIDTKDEVFIVLEYMEGRELNNRIVSTVPLTESNAKFLFFQMVQAVQFLHSNGITHRDLKPENVLLSSTDVETIVKVSDFGLSKITEDDDMMRTICGTPQYIAPEVLDTRIPEYDKQVDVWSLGVILFYMLSKELPFRSPNREILSNLIITGTYVMDELSWNGVSYFAKDLVKRMLTVNPEKRITISEILHHPWIARDAASMQYRINLLLKKQKTGSDTEENDDSNETNSDMTPPTKRARLSSSDESI